MDMVTEAHMELALSRTAATPLAHARLGAPMKAGVVSVPLRDWLPKKPAWLDRQTAVGLTFAVKTFAASLLALYIAFWAGLDDPRWAFLTVFIVSQPDSGLVLAKSFYRILGTIAGPLFRSRSYLVWPNMANSSWPRWPYGSSSVIFSLVRCVISRHMASSSEAIRSPSLASRPPLTRLEHIL